MIKTGVYVPVLTPKPEFFNLNSVLLHNFVTLKCRVCIPKRHSAHKYPKKKEKQINPKRELKGKVEEHKQTQFGLMVE